MMSFEQRFIYNLSLSILTGAISTDLDDAISDDLIYMSLAKSSSDNKSIGKKEWLRSIRNNNGNHTPRFCLEVVYENDEIVVCKGTKTVNGAPQISVFCMNIDGEKITYVQHLTGPAY